MDISEYLPFPLRGIEYSIISYASSYVKNTLVDHSFFFFIVFPTIKM